MKNGGWVHRIHRWLEARERNQQSKVVEQESPRILRTTETVQREEKTFLIGTFDAGTLKTCPLCGQKLGPSPRTTHRTFPCSSDVLHQQESSWQDPHLSLFNGTPPERSICFGTGFEYRPPLSENIVVRGGASALVPGQSLKDIYNGRVLFSVFGNVKFQF